MVQSVVRDGQLFYKRPAAVDYDRHHQSYNGIITFIFESRLTLPSEASSNWTGDSRTEATKQNADASRGVARGYQIKSRMGAARGNVLVFGRSNGARADWGNDTFKKSCGRSRYCSVRFSQCARASEPSGHHLAERAKFSRKWGSEGK